MYNTYRHALTHIHIIVTYRNMLLNNKYYILLFQYKKNGKKTTTK